MITPRLSLFEADSWNYIYTQSNTIGATTLLQTLNIDKVNFHGIEGVLSMKDVYWHGLGFMTSATFTDFEILADSPCAVVHRQSSAAHSAHPPARHHQLRPERHLLRRRHDALRNGLFREPCEHRFQSRLLWQHGQLLSRLRREGALQIRAELDRDRRHQQHRQQQSSGQSQSLSGAQLTSSA